MKAEITLENKRRFFLLYHDVEINHRTGEYGEFITPLDYISVIPHWIERLKLPLTPLSDITDEDAMEVAEILDISPDKEWISEIFFENRWSHRTESVARAVDFLRFRSYLVSWMGLSPDELIEAGWVELKNKKCNP